MWGFRDCSIYLSCIYADVVPPKKKGRIPEPTSIHEEIHDFFWRCSHFYSSCRQTSLTKRYGHYNTTVLIALHVCYPVEIICLYFSKCTAAPTTIVPIVVQSNEGAPAPKPSAYFYVEYAFSNTSFIIYESMARMTVLETNPGKKKGRIPNLVQSRSLKPRGEPDGPKRTPPDLGDKWQHIIAFEAE